MDLSQLQAASSHYAKPPDFTPSYGTAGFRAPAALLPSTVFRCGVLMAARSLKTGGVTGLVVTASHNPECDNGVKLVEPTGYMLSQEWEAHADRLANAANDAALVREVSNLQEDEGIPAGTAEVMIAHDTRQSAAELVQAAQRGVQSVGGTATLCGLLTTPQLHWMVRQRQQGRAWDERSYFTALSDAYEALTKGKGARPEELHIDCANGVGASKLRDLQPLLQHHGLRLRLYNCGSGVLNKGCGADFVQKERQAPAEFDDLASMTGRCASIDGDADRLVYFRHHEGQLQLLDGDKIAVLAALFLRSLMQGLSHIRSDLTLGVVQTAYANGSSTVYMRDTLGCDVAITPTGVKHLHEAAMQFHVGIYFEANGHGTVLFDQSLLEDLKQVQLESQAARHLLAVADMVNQAVGDAISGVFLVEVALQWLGMSVDDWAGLYADLPSRQLKVKVEDRSVVATADAETRAVAPAGLQDTIHGAVRRTLSGRAFVRPSGTEDVVRVYAEASTQDEADVLAKAVARAVYDKAAGVGPRP